MWSAGILLAPSHGRMPWAKVAGGMPALHMTSRKQGPAGWHTTA